MNLLKILKIKKMITQLDDEGKPVKTIFNEGKPVDSKLTPVFHKPVETNNELTPEEKELLEEDDIETIKPESKRTIEVVSQKKDSPKTETKKIDTTTNIAYEVNVKADGDVKKILVFARSLTEIDKKLNSEFGEGHYDVVTVCKSTSLIL